jgi:hypothetical protein
MLGSFERLCVGNAATLTEETLLSGHRLEFTYILGTFSERISKKCGHARLSAKILHNLLSLRSRSLRPSVKRRTLAVSISFTRCGARFQLSTPHSAQFYQPPSENSQHLTDFQGTLEPASDFGLERRGIAAVYAPRVDNRGGALLVGRGG